MAVNLSDDHKFQILKEVYLELRKEISFWHERSFKVTMWLTGLMLTAFSAAAFGDGKQPIILIPVFGLSFMATLYLHKNYRNCVDRLKRLIAVEEALKFFENNAYIQGNPIYPPNLRIPAVKYIGTLFFILTIWIMAFSVAVINIVPIEKLNLLIK